MRCRSLGAAATTVALLLTFPLASAALAEVSVDRRHNRERDASEQFEALALRCEVRAAGPAVVCRWSRPGSSLAVGVRVVRFDPAVDPYRMTVLRTDDLGTTELVDGAVRRGHQYGYVVQALSAAGRVVARSRAAWVRVPAAEPGVEPEVEVLRLACALAPGGEAIGCEWSAPGDAAAVVSLWRSVDDGGRELVGRFRPGGPTSYRDRVPAGAALVTYAVVATSEAGDVVAQSRPEPVRIPSVAVRPSVAPPVATRPATTATRPAATTATTRPAETRVPGR